VTAVDRVAPKSFHAPRGSRRLAAAASLYILAVGAVTFLRAGSAENVMQNGETAAALGMVLPLFCGAVALVILAVRAAALSIDDSGVSWGVGPLAFRLRARAIETCRHHADAVAVVRRGGRFTWYVCARDYQPFPEVVAAFRRARLPATEDGGPAPLAARLQSYGVAVDLLIVVDALAVTALFLVV
jgi:hypothetical protein